MGTATKTISYRYDANRNRTLMIDPEGGRTTYSYDVLNRVTQIINPQGERTTFAYDAKGRKTVKKLANGTRASFTYDAASRLTTLANLKSDSSVISKFDYKYDNVGNRTEVAEADGSRVTWSYDNTYQLLSEHRAGTSPYRNTFTYDNNGNRLVKNENNARTTYAYDAANQLKISVDAQGTTTYIYDADGNQELVQAPTGARTTTTWDYENRTTLVQLPTGTRNTMSYEPDGLRVKLEDSTGTKKFIWDEQNYLAESDENNDTKAVYTNEPTTYGNLISQRRKSAAIWTPSYYHQEALGSTRELTDSVEAITDTYLYDAWGNVISSTGTTLNPFQWTGNVGYYFDSDTGNFYIRARIYGPTVGRWLSVDPLGFVDGVNLYFPYYIPGKWDPSGQFCGPDCNPLPDNSTFDPTNATCDEICEEIQRNKKLAIKGGGIICWCGKECPCIFDINIKKPNKIKVKRGECKFLDRCSNTHEKAHLADVECDEDNPDPYRGGPKEEDKGTAYPKNRECRLRRNEANCLRGSLPRSSDKCKQFMILLIYHQCTWINRHCQNIPKKGNDVC